MRVHVHDRRRDGSREGDHPAVPQVQPRTLLPHLRRRQERIRRERDPGYLCRAEQHVHVRFVFALGASNTFPPEQEVSLEKLLVSPQRYEAARALVKGELRTTCIIANTLRWARY